MYIVKDTPETNQSNLIITDNELKNDFCRIRYDLNGSVISGTDLTDKNNEPSFFTQTKRGVAKKWEQLSQEFNEETKFRAVINIIQDKIKVHTYCAMD